VIHLSKLQLLQGILDRGSTTGASKLLRMVHGGGETLCTVLQCALDFQPALSEDWRCNGSSLLLLFQAAQLIAKAFATGHRLSTHTEKKRCRDVSLDLVLGEAVHTLEVAYRGSMMGAITLPDDVAHALTSNPDKVSIKTSWSSRHSLADSNARDMLSIWLKAPSRSDSKCASAPDGFQCVKLDVEDGSQCSDEDTWEVMAHLPAAVKSAQISAADENNPPNRPPGESAGLGTGALLIAA
jgi:hypothetical protein